MYIEKYLCENINSISKVCQECMKNIKHKICTMCKKVYIQKYRRFLMV